MGTPILQSVPMKGAVATGGVGRQNEPAEPGVGAGGYTISYAGVGVKSGELGNGAKGFACTGRSCSRGEKGPHEWSG